MGRDFETIYGLCEKYMTNPKVRVQALYSAVKNVIATGAPGAFVECGVFRGGNPMLIAYTLLELNVTDRKIYLYDTFNGMTKPTAEDYRVSDKNRCAIARWKKGGKWCYASLSEVKANMASTGYPKENVVFVEGKVEDTIPKTVPSRIALLRLDTDWYESTKHELIHLFPLLAEGGCLIIDDYGHWAGARKATDEYFSDKQMLLVEIVHGGSARIGIKKTEKGKVTDE